MGILDIFKTLLGQSRDKKKSRTRKGKGKSKRKSSGYKRKQQSRTTGAKTKRRVVSSTRSKKKSRVSKVKSVKKKSTGQQKKKKTIKTPYAKIKKTERKVKETEIGIVTHYFNKISVAVVKLKAPLKIGDKIRIKGKHDDFLQTVSSMQINHQPVSYAGKGAEIGLKVKQRAHENDRVYKVS
jgi:hypothetical protein